MTPPTLASSPVIFLPEEHRYFNPENGRYLSGITSLLSRQLFPDKYDGIPQATLDAAAAKGSAIHEECADLATFGVAGTYPETEAFARLLTRECIEPLEAEYTVSDGEHYASKIDFLDRSLNLYDIKTTSTLDTEYVSWQLSIYAHLFEQQNPGLQVGRLAAIHLRGKRAKLVRVERKSYEAVSRLLADDLAGRQYTHQPDAHLTPAGSADAQDGVLTKLTDIERAILEIKTRLAQAEEQKKSLTEALYREMDARGVYKLDSPTLSITRIADTTAETFDSKAFRADHPELYGKYLRETQRKGYVKITLKQ